MLYGLEPGLQRRSKRHGAYDMFQELKLIFRANARCRCQNRRISGRGSRTVRLGGWLQEAGDTMFTQVRALLMEVIPYVLLDCS